MKNPKVSVLVPLYNTNENHLREMIESVLNQTFTDFELMLLNDSPDNQQLVSVVQSYQDNRIIYVENPRNLGISASRNRLVDMARGEYLAIFDHDDICVPDRLELEVSYLDSHPEVGVCSGWLQKMSNNELLKMPEDNDEIKDSLMFFCCVVHSAAMIRKSVLIDYGIRYEANYSPAEDYLLWIRLLGVTMFYNYQKPLIFYRDHEDNTTNRQIGKMRDKDRMIKCIAYKEYPYLLPENRKRIWLNLFGVIPFIKIKTSGNRRSYFLFGFVPLWTRRAQ